jgi:hypothetical protein
MFSRMYCREILDHIDRRTIEPEVLAALEAGAGQIAQQAPGVDPFASAPPLIDLNTMQPLRPEFMPVQYTEAQLAKITIPIGDGTTRPATQADIDEVNRVRRNAFDAEQRVRENYVPNLNPKDAANAAFAPPDIPDARRRSSDVPVGEKNRHGDECIGLLNGSNASVFACSNGHHYTDSPSVPGCPICFMSG